MKRLLLALLLFALPAAGQQGVGQWSPPMPQDPTGIIGGIGTETTLRYLYALKEFEGLDPSISWTTYYFNPYTGSDSNDCSEKRPCETISKALAVTAHGSRVKFASGPTGPIYSHKTYKDITGLTGLCAIGEIVSYDAGASTARVLDVDAKAGVMAFEDVSGTTMGATETITGADTACLGNVTTLDDTIDDGSTDPAGGVTLASPTQYANRITALWEPTDARYKVRINCNKDGMNAGTPSSGGVLYADGAAVGVFGVQNFAIDACGTDAVGQSNAARVRVLNIDVDREWNVSAAKNNNCFTTHNNGALEAVNSTCRGYPYDDSAGSPIAPTATASFVMIGQGDLAADYTNYATTNKSNVFAATEAGSIVVIGHQISAYNAPSTQSNGGIRVDGGANASTAVFAKVTSGPFSGSGTQKSCIQSTASSFSTTISLYQVTFAGCDRGILLDRTSGTATVTARDILIDGLVTGYIVYQWGNAAWTGISLDLQGIYDDEDAASSYWLGGSAGANYTDQGTALTAVDANAPAWTFFETNSTDSNGSSAGDQFAADARYRCATSAKECWQTAATGYAISLPVVLYDYTAIPISGFSLGGSSSGVPQNRGAR